MLPNSVATLFYVHTLHKAASPYIQAYKDIQPQMDMDLIVKKVGITCYLLGIMIHLIWLDLELPAGGPHIWRRLSYPL
jgi:hypothetical protein